MNLVTIDNFVNDIALPINGNAVSIAKINEAITFYEKDYLRLVLGTYLYNEFLAGLAETNPDEIWTNLRDGADFTFDLNGDEITEHFNGMTELAALYIYCKIRNENETYFGVSQIKSISENSVVADFTEKIVQVWNKLVDGTGQVEKNFNKNSEYYHTTDLPSAYNFLLANKDVYVNWKFNPIYKINDFSI